MNQKLILYFAFALSLVVVWLSIPSFKSAVEDTLPDQPTWVPGIALSLFPIAALTFVFIALRGVKGRGFNILLGLLLATMSWEFLADPWSVEWRLKMMPEAGMGPVLIYMLIGTTFVLLSVFFFRRGLREE